MCWLSPNYLAWHLSGLHLTLRLTFQSRTFNIVVGLSACWYCTLGSLWVRIHTLRSWLAVYFHAVSFHNGSITPSCSGRRCPIAFVALTRIWIPLTNWVEESLKWLHCYRWERFVGVTAMIPRRICFLDPEVIVVYLDQCNVEIPGFSAKRSSTVNALHHTQINGVVVDNRGSF